MVFSFYLRLTVSFFSQKHDDNRVSARDTFLGFFVHVFFFSTHPNLNLERFSIDLDSLESKVNADGWCILHLEFILSVAKEERRLASATVTQRQETDDLRLGHLRVGFLVWQNRFGKKKSVSDILHRGGKKKVSFLQAHTKKKATSQQRRKKSHNSLPCRLPSFSPRGCAYHAPSHNTTNVGIRGQLGVSRDYSYSLSL